jgi:CRP/FNR family transcriptional regulator
MNDAERTLFLKELLFFRGLPEEQIDLLAKSMADRVYEPGEIIATENQPMRGFYLVVTGQVKLFRMTAEGKEQTIYVFGPGEPFCMCGLFEGGRCPANAQAMERTRVLSMRAGDLERLAAREPQVMFNLLALMSRRVQSAMDLIESLSLKELPERLAVFLLRLDRDPDEPDLVRLPMTHRELAKVVGASPEAVSRALKRMAEADLLAVSGRDIYLLDEAGLEDLGAGELEI